MTLHIGKITQNCGIAGKMGCPVDAIADAKDNILISNDSAGAVYQLYPIAQ